MSTARPVHLLTLAVFAAIMALAAFVAPRLFVLFDEAYNLSVSKTLAAQGVYASHTADGYRLFDPQVSTGPTLLVPLALALRLGGANIAVARVAMLVIFLGCLALSYWAARELLGDPAAVGFLIVFATTPLVLVFGLCVLGDVPAISLGLAALALFSRAERHVTQQWPLLLLSGLCLGLAILAKDIIVLFLPAFVLACCADIVARRSVERDRLLANLVPVVMALAIVGGWRGFQVSAMWLTSTPQEFAAWQSSLVVKAGEMSAAVAFAPLSHLTATWRENLDYYGPLLLGFVVGIMSTALLRFPVPLVDTKRLAQRVIAAAFVVWLVWYFALSGPQALNRHLLPGVVLGELLIVALVARLWQAARAVGVRVRRAALLAAVVTVVLLWSVAHGLGFTRLYLASSVPRLAMQQAAEGWIRENVSPAATLSGWGWYTPWHIAFLADRVPAAVHPEASDLHGLSDWFVLSPEIEWGGGMGDRLRDFLARQGPPAFAQRLYPIYRVTWRPTAP